MEHIPVLLNETIEALQVKRGGRYVDGTFGRGGHARAIAAEGGEVLGIDRDEAAVAAAGEMHVVKGRHADLRSIANENGWESVEGVLLDLGVSSPQLDEAGRGFSFLREGPLDMRMDRTQDLTAATLVNGTDADELAHIFREWGEEPQARRIAKAIVKRVAENGEFRTTVELADFIERLIGRRNGKHPATRVFQALRMAVNDEGGELNAALEGGLALLKSNGRFAVITFESVTDRMVKQFFVAHEGREVSQQSGGARWEGMLPRVRRVTRRAVTPGEGEILRNPRARSAKLRVIEKL